MFFRIKMFVASVLTATLAFGTVAVPALAQINPNTGEGAVTCGAQGNFTGEDCQQIENADQKVNSALIFAIRIFQAIVGLVAVFMLIFGGLKYVTSGGESAAMGGAKNTIIYAIIGLVVVVLAELIVQFVLNRVNQAVTI